MKTKLLLALIAAGFANVAVASSPFMVKHATAQADGGRAVMQADTGKTTTLAEYLVQERQCSATDHVGSGSTDGQSQAHNGTPVKRSPE